MPVRLTSLAYIAMKKRVRLDHHPTHAVRVHREPLGDVFDHALGVMGVETE